MVAKLLAQADRASVHDYNHLLSLLFRGLPIDLLGALPQCPDKNVIAGARFIAEELAERAAPVLDIILLRLKHDDAKRLSHAQSKAG
ncbi:MAG TPA: hypothetical protein VG055_04375 [Planctomycetaceae bacterium]|nr:hypothetical protein [Planctomycetaceae bacterium]